MTFTEWSPAELLSFFMVMIRVSTLIMILPIFGDKVIPATVKVLLSLTVSAVLFPILKESGAVRVSDAVVWSQTTGGLLLTLGAEMLVGLSIGFASQLIFHAIHAGGDFMAQFMGLSMASQYDPHAESQTMVLSQLLGTLAMLTFLAVDGHHLLLRAMIESFRLIPQGHFGLGEAIKSNLVHLVGNVLYFGVQLSAPMAACMILVNMIYGILGKTLPQLNILTLSMASGVFIGGFVLLVTYPSLQSGFVSLYDTYFSDLKQLMVVYGGK